MSLYQSKLVILGLNLLAVELIRRRIEDIASENADAVDFTQPLQLGNGTLETSKHVLSALKAIYEAWLREEQNSLDMMGGMGVAPEVMFALKEADPELFLDTAFTDGMLSIERVINMAETPATIVELGESYTNFTEGAEKFCRQLNKAIVTARKAVHFSS